MLSRSIATNIIFNGVNLPHAAKDAERETH